MKKITRDAETVFVLKSEKSLFIKLIRAQKDEVKITTKIGASANNINLIEYIRE